MTGRARWQCVLAGLVAGLAGGLFGVGGGVILVPILTGVFALGQHRAHGTSLAVIGIAALAGLFVYGAFASVAWGTAAVVALTSVLAAPLGAKLASRTSPGTLRKAFALFMVLVALRLWWKIPQATGASFHHGAAGVAFDLGLGLAVGLLSGYMGVGGGLLAVPAFTLALRMTQQAAQGTSLAVILVTGPAGAIVHARHGNVVWSLVPLLALGAALSAPLASWLAQQLPHEALVRAFAVFLLLNAALAWFRTQRSPAAADPAGATGGTDP